MDKTRESNDKQDILKTLSNNLEVSVPKHLNPTDFTKKILDKPTTPHYDCKKIQPLEYILANNLDFCEGNIIKYITRYKEKNGMEDLLKAKDYLNTLIENYN